MRAAHLGIEATAHRMMTDWRVPIGEYRLAPVFSVVHHIDIVPVRAPGFSVSRGHNHFILIAGQAATRLPSDQGAHAANIATINWKAVNKRDK